MYFIGLGTATPARRYEQRECWEALQSAELLSRLSPRSRAILRKVLLGDNGIATRYLALEPLTQAFEVTPDALQASSTSRTRSTPALWPAAPGNPRFFAQRLLPSIMMATCLREDMSGIPCRLCKHVSDFHQIAFFGREGLVNFSNILVSQFLNIFLGAPLVILANLLVLEQVFQLAIGITPDIAH